MTRFFFFSFFHLVPFFLLLSLLQLRSVTVTSTHRLSSISLLWVTCQIPFLFLPFYYVWLFAPACLIRVLVLPVDRQVTCITNPKTTRIVAAQQQLSRSVVSDFITSSSIVIQ
ncbi:hypothetical protein GGS26DRAFT_93024 [Hypomontagnella submonticulosa]|nr:hypothetical protein GGS26DRAFT_93024 [Hypomontagnella submonticulosa]